MWGFINILQLPCGHSLLLITRPQQLLKIQTHKRVAVMNRFLPSPQKTWSLRKEPRLFIISRLQFLSTLCASHFYSLRICDWAALFGQPIAYLKMSKAMTFTDLRFYHTNWTAQVRLFVKHLIIFYQLSRVYISPQILSHLECKQQTEENLN